MSAADTVRVTWDSMPSGAKSARLDDGWTLYVWPTDGGRWRWTTDNGRIYPGGGSSPSEEAAKAAAVDFATR